MKKERSKGLDWVATIREVPTPQLLCMRGAYGHEWDEISKPYKEGQWGYRFNSRCIRCSKERTTIFNIYGIEAAHYYLTPAWHVRVEEPYESADVRLELVRRMRSEGLKSETRGHLRVVND